MLIFNSGYPQCDGKVVSLYQKIICCTYPQLQTKSDERLSLTAEFIAGIRLLKLNALEFIYQQKIEHVRKRELRLLLKDSLFWALNST